MIGFGSAKKDGVSSKNKPTPRCFLIAYRLPPNQSKRNVGSTALEGRATKSKRQHMIPDPINGLRRNLA